MSSSIGSEATGAGEESSSMTVAKSFSAPPGSRTRARTESGARPSVLGSGSRTPFETFATRVDRIIDAGEHVVVLTRIRARGRASGADVDAKVGAIFTLRDAKIVRYVLTDSREALEAVGLPE